MPIKIDIKSIENVDFRMVCVENLDVIEIYAASIDLKNQLKQALVDSGIMFDSEVGTFKLSIPDCHAFNIIDLKCKISDSLRESGYRVLHESLTRSAIEEC